MHVFASKIFKVNNIPTCTSDRKDEAVQGSCWPISLGKYQLREKLMTKCHGIGI